MMPGLIPARMRHALEWIENTMLALAFAVSVLLPLAEIVLRTLLHTGIEGVTSYVQHLTLAAGMMGAAVAARERRLLTLSVATLITNRAQTMMTLASDAVGATVSGLLGLAAWNFVSIERGAGNLLLPWLPVWIAELPLPLGFGLIALRLACNPSTTLKARFAVIAIATCVLALLRFGPLTPHQILAPALVAIGAATLLGAPIFVAVGGCALFLLEYTGVPDTAMAVDHYSLVVNPSLPAIPMFTLAGYLLAESAAPRRLIELFDALFGRLRGGAAIVTVLACTFFTSFTGASGVTILALGGLAMPLLLATGYPSKTALGLVTSAGLPGTLLMPSLPLILYAIVAHVSIENMFRGGALPTLLMVGIVATWGITRKPRDERAGQERFDPHRARRALAAARWELSLPLVPVIALASGLATPVESAALTAFYAFLITTVIHRDLSVVNDVPRVLVRCGLIVGGILLILGVALGLTDYLVDTQIPDRMVAWVIHTVKSRFVFLLALNGFLLLAGCVMEIYPAIVVLAPLVTNIGAAFSIDPVHLGTIFLANMELGYLTPLVGLNLFFASYRFDKPIGEVYRAAAPLFLWLGVGVLVITYVPYLSTALLDSH